MDARIDDRGELGRRNRPRKTPKGRQVDPTALDEVRALLADRPRRRDLLIEYLHLIQDRYGYLSAGHLSALAQEMSLALTEVYEVATFYAHFDVVKEDEAPPPAVTVRVCDSLSCAMAGSEHLLRTLPNRRKWTLVRAEPAPRLFAVNADEGEPGTFKDRYYLEQDPHRFIEGMLIAAWVVEAANIYIYIRDEYPEVRLMLADEIAKVERAGLAKHAKLHLRRGAGAYICGEESAMIESIEGKRGLPRHRPPYVAQVGLFGRPTLEQNVETLYWVRDIVEKGPAWFTSHGRRGRKGLRSFSVSGRVREPGVKLAPAGITIRELIDEYCGGMVPGHTFKGYLPGGASGGILPASMG